MITKTEIFIKKQQDIFDREYSDFFDASEKSGFFKLVRPYVNRQISNFVKKVLNGNSAVLDVGCGDGAILHAVLDKITNAVGVDLSSVAIRKARKLFGESEKISFHQGLFEDFSSDLQFNAILMLDVFEHFVDINLALRKSRYFLKDGGILVISTPNKNRLTNVVKNCIKTKIELIESHFKEYSLGELETLLTKYGFAIKRIEANTLLDLKYIPKWLLSKNSFVKAIWSLGRIFRNLASNFNIVAHKL